MPQDRNAVAAAPGRAAAGATGLDPRIERDHAAISNLADDLLPALIAKLATSGLGEIEVREGAWKARLRRPAGADDRKGSGRGSVAGTRARPCHRPRAGRGRRAYCRRGSRAARPRGG